VAGSVLTQFSIFTRAARACKSARVYILLCCCCCCCCCCCMLARPLLNFNSLITCHCSRAYSLVSCNASGQQQRAHMQFGILPLQVTAERSCCCCCCCCCMFARPLLNFNSLRNCHCSRAAACAYMQFNILLLQPGSSHVVARNYPAVL
jgi:hypothetical protein